MNFFSFVRSFFSAWFLFHLPFCQRFWSLLTQRVTYLYHIMCVCVRNEKKDMLLRKSTVTLRKTPGRDRGDLNALTATTLAQKFHFLIISARCLSVVGWNRIDM
jgi:hypothetical protein